METKKRLFVIFWQYQANYSEPEIVEADSPLEAFEQKFHFYGKSKHPDFHRYIIEITDRSKFTELKPE